MTCMHCVGRVDKALTALNGVKRVSVDLEGESAEIEYNPEIITPNDFRDAVTEAGYEFILHDVCSLCYWRRK